MEGIAQYDFAARRHQASTLALDVGFQAFFLRPICMSQAFNFPKLSTVTPAQMPSSCKGIPDAQFTGSHLTLCKKQQDRRDNVPFRMAVSHQCVMKIIQTEMKVVSSPPKSRFVLGSVNDCLPCL